MARKVLKPIKAKKSPKVDRTYEVLCSIEAGLAALHIDLDRVVAAQQSVVDVLRLQPQQSKVDLLKLLVEGQKALTDTLLLLTAKGVAKAREKKEPPTPQAITEQVNQAGREMAQEQRVGLEKAVPALPVEEKKPDLKVVPPLAPSSAAGPAPTASETKPAPTLDQLKTTFLNYVARNSREKGIELLKNFGAQKVTDVPPSQYERFSLACS